ncbi:MAG: acyl-CoA thioesterase, partial [Polyangiales bacterium]
MSPGRDDALKSMAFVTDIPVHFADVDHAQVVYYPRFFDFFHRAFEAFLRAQGHSLRHIIDVDGVGLPVVHAEADYR